MLTKPTIHGQARRGTRFFMLALFAGGIVAHPLQAQLGDAPGELQEPQVPAEQIPPSPPLSPEDALGSMILPSGYRMEIAASEPLVQDPVAVTFGPDGRMWVVEMRGYMSDLDGQGEDAPVGRIVVLNDQDGDGRYDESHVFLDELVLPRTVLLVGDGVLVGAPPELAFWQDTNGDGIADHKTVLASDYGTKIDPDRPYFSNPELAPNSLLWARDNWIYSAAYVRKFRYAKGSWESAPTAFRGQWGLSFDDYGRFYYNSNSDQLRVDVIFADYLARNPNFMHLSGANVQTAADQFVWPARVNPGVNRGYNPDVLRDGKLKAFTAACSPWIYRGDLMPELYGNAFIAEPAGNLVRRNLVVPHDGSLTAKNAYDRSEFIGSTDERFRPVAFATGPDGALYVVDMYHGVLQHRLSMTTYLRQQSLERHLTEPIHCGRIYRIVPAGSLPQRQSRIAELSSAGWVERLADPNAWWGETAQRLLVERRAPETIPAIRTMAVTLSPLGRARALWTLEGMEALDADLVFLALDDAAPMVRETAIRLSESLLKGSRRDELIGLLLDRCEDEAAQVQLQAVLTLGTVGNSDIDYKLAQIVRTHPENKFLTDALYSGIGGREIALLDRLLSDSNWPTEDRTANEIVAGIAGGIMASRDLVGVERLFTRAAILADSHQAQAFAIINGAADIAEQSRRPWQLAKEPAGWNSLADLPALAVQMKAMKNAVLWPGKHGVTYKPVPALTEAQIQRFETGSQLYAGICAGCHQSTGRGLAGLAPPLLDSEWVVGKSGRLIRVLLHGLSGPIKVQKRHHIGEMPAFGTVFSDEQLASVLTYIRREWGHEAPAIDPDEVGVVRAATKDHSGSWSMEELRWIQ